MISKSFRNISRLSRVFEYATSQYLPRFLGLVLSWYVVTFFSSTLWGEYVSYLIYINLILVVISFGSFEYNLRAFSKDSKNISQIWSNSLIARALCFVIIIPACLMLPGDIILKTGILAWLAGGFLSQSYQPYIVYSNRFRKLILIEVISFLFFAGLLIGSYKYLSLEVLVLCKGLSVLVKSIILKIFFDEDLKLKTFRGKLFNYYKLSAFFFFLSLIGLLTTNVDLYVVNYFMEKDQVGNYHILSCFLVLIHAGARQIIAPFVKNTYRLKYSSIKKISRTIAFLGSLIVPLGLLVTYLIMKYAYQISYQPAYWIVSGIYVFTSYVGTAHVYWIFQMKLERKILVLNVFVVLFNVIFSVIFIRKYSILAVLLGHAISQWLFALMVIFYSKRISMYRQATARFGNYE